MDKEKPKRRTRTLEYECPVCGSDLEPYNKHPAEMDKCPVCGAEMYG